MGVCCAEPDSIELNDGNNIKFKSIEKIDQEEDKKRHNTGGKPRSILKKNQQP